MQIKISVIIPVYKAEAYIDKCIQDILGQKFKDFELLLVLDGSFDESEDICDKWALKDSRIKVIKEQHAGVAHARQVGIDNVHGEYILFVDADDTVSPTMLEEMYNVAKEQDADIVISDFTELTHSGDIYRSQQPSSLNGLSILEDILNGKLYGALWNKLISTEAIRRSKAHFVEALTMREDFVFLSELLPHVNKIAYIPKAFYGYERRNVSSLTNKYLDESVGYYRQEVLWNSLILQNQYISESSRNKILNYYSQLAYITLKKGLFNKEEWDKSFHPYQREIAKIKMGYKSRIVSFALKRWFYTARLCRTVISKLHSPKS